MSFVLSSDLDPCLIDILQKKLKLLKIIVPLDMELNLEGDLTPFSHHFPLLLISLVDPFWLPELPRVWSDNLEQTSAGLVKHRQGAVYA